MDAIFRGKLLIASFVAYLVTFILRVQLHFSIKGLAMNEMTSGVSQTFLVLAVVVIMTISLLGFTQPPVTGVRQTSRAWINVPECKVGNSPPSITELTKT